MSVFIHYGNLQSIIKRCPITSLIILLNTFMFIITIFTGGFDTINLVHLGAIFPELILYLKEYHRLILAIFLHGSVLHYLLNTFFGILIICAGLEKVIGSLRFLVIYLGSGLISSLTVTYFSTGITVGASGAIFGVMGAFGAIILFNKDLLSYTDQSYIKKLLLLNLVMTFLTPYISVSGHLGGLLGGFILGVLFIRMKRSY